MKMQSVENVFGIQTPTAEGYKAQTNLLHFRPGIIVDDAV